MRYYFMFLFVVSALLGTISLPIGFVIGLHRHPPAVALLRALEGSAYLYGLAAAIWIAYGCLCIVVWIIEKAEKSRQGKH